MRRVVRGVGFCCLLLLTSVPACRERETPSEAEPSVDRADAPSRDAKLFNLATPKADATSVDRNPPDSSTVGCAHLVDVAAEVGLDFVYETGARGQSLMVETMGGGCGSLDFDCDGRQDFFLCQGGDPTADSHDQSQPRDALFRNDPSGHFLNVSENALPSGLFRYGQGVTVGDFNNDGFDDIYITNVESNVLLKNMGDGTFLDVTEEAGVGDPRWSSSAAFADLTGDGNLDLFVCNYVVYDPKDPIECRNADGEYRICHPREMESYPNECYINLGDGRFRAEARERGLMGEGSKSLGVAIADFTDNGLPDIYVANDTTANFLFVNRGQGLFDEQGLLRACAMDRNGAYQASMGLGIGDYDRDGMLDIYVTHFYEESNTLYRNLGPSGFRDVTGFVGLHDPTMLRLGFGTVMRDFNQDGWQELFITNGHIENYPGNTLHRMRPQLFSSGKKRFVECTEQAGEFFQQRVVGRGVAASDFDDDGDVDLVVVHQDAPAALLQNDSDRGNWLKLFFRGRQSNRRGIGCRVTVTAGEQRWVQELYGGGSYASSHEPALIFGLGDEAGPCRVKVRWPNGNVQILEQVGINQSVGIDERNASETEQP